MLLCDHAFNAQLEGLGGLSSAVGERVGMLALGGS